MIVCDNGTYRPETEEELAAWSNPPQNDYPPTDAERIDALEEAIRKGMSL